MLEWPELVYCRMLGRGPVVRYRLMLVVLVGLLVAVVGAALLLGRSTIRRSEILAGADSVVVAGWETPWEIVSVGDAIRVWAPSDATSTARHGVFLDVASYQVPLIARWEHGRRDEGWYPFGDLDSPDRPSEMTHPSEILSADLGVSGERVWCAIGDADRRCDAWLWDGRLGQHVISVAITDLSGITQEEAIDLVRQALIRLYSS